MAVSIEIPPLQAFHGCFYNISISGLFMAVSIIPPLQTFHDCFYNTSIAGFSWLFL